MTHQEVANIYWSIGEIPYFITEIIDVYTNQFKKSKKLHFAYSSEQLQFHRNVFKEGQLLTIDKNSIAITSITVSLLSETDPMTKPFWKNVSRGGTLVSHYATSESWLYSEVGILSLDSEHLLSLIIWYLQRLCIGCNARGLVLYHDRTIKIYKRQEHKFFAEAAFPELY